MVISVFYIGADNPKTFEETNSEMAEFVNL